MNNNLNKNLSVVVPTLNEEGNITPLVQRIHKSLTDAKINYEIIFIDDHSTDGTVAEAYSLAETYPIFVHLKKGEKGKSFSLLEGFKYTKYDVICMIDADNQYPAEAMPEMYENIYSHQTDIVLSDRKYENVSIKRKIMSRTFRVVFGHLLHNLNFDIQSGLKMFRKEVVENIQLNPTPWTFDLEFLIKARKLKYTISEVSILFTERYVGTSKINNLKDTYEISLSAVKLKFSRN